MIPLVNDAETPADSPGAASADSQPGYSPYRLGVGIGIVLALAAVFLFLSFLSIWFDRQVLDSKQWTDTSTQVIEQPAVQNALANYLVDQLFNNVDVEQEIRQQLPSNWEVLATPATSALRSLTLSGAKKVLELPITQEAWAAANARAHEALIATLEGGNEHVSTENGVVKVDARLILEDVAHKLGLSGNLVGKIPASAGSFVVYESDHLSTAQAAYKAANNLRWIFALLTIALYVLALALASGRRRRAVIWMGVSFVVVALLVLIAQSLGRSAVVDSLAQTSAVVPAVTDVYNIATELLRKMASSLLVTGLLVVGGGILAGPYRWAVATRRFLAPYLRDNLALSTAAAALLFLIVLWLVPISGFRTAVGLLINAALAIAGFIALVVTTRHEFPDAEPADFGRVGEWIGARWSSARGYVTEKTGQIELPRVGSSETTREVTTKPAEAAHATEEADDVTKLERLQKLHEGGSLTDAEFAAMKKQILGE